MFLRLSLFPAELPISGSTPASIKRRAVFNPCHFTTIPAGNDFYAKISEREFCGMASRGKDPPHKMLQLTKNVRKDSAVPGPRAGP